MTLIQHKQGNVFLPKYKLKFLPGKPVEIENEKLAEKILRNPDFFEAKETGSKELEQEKSKRREK